MRKKILATVLGVTICLGSMTGCAQFKRGIIDMKKRLVWRYEQSHCSVYSRR